jgi:hypothetical protein
LLTPPIQNASLCGVVIESKPIRQSNWGKKGKKKKKKKKKKPSSYTKKSTLIDKIV